MKNVILRTAPFLVMLIFLIPLSCFEKSTNPIDSDTIDELQLKGSISGKVYNSKTLKGISGIAITTDSAGFSTTSDSSGFYRIPNVSGGTYRITFSSESYFDTTLDSIKLIINEDKQNVDVAMRSRFGGITGVVNDSLTNTPVDGATITLQPGGTSTITNSSGAYSFGGIREGWYSITITSPKHISKVIDSIFITGNDSVSVLEFKLRQKYSSISGIVTDNLGNPLSGVSAQVDSLHKDITSDDGRFTLNDLISGKYVITFTSNIYGTTKSDTINLTSGTDTTGITVKLLSAKSSIKGKVNDKNGNAIAGVAVSITGLPTIITTDDGTYLLNNIPAGIYQITFTHADYQTFRKDSVKITSNQHLSGIDAIMISKYGQICGKIIDSTNGAPLAGVGISVEGIGETTSSPDGNFTITKVNPGTYTITFTLNTFVSLSISGIKLEPDQIINGLEIKLQPIVGSISGIVTDTAGNPINAVVVIADSSHKDITGDDGKFTVSNLREGSYTLKLSSSQFAPAKSDTIFLKAGKDTSGFNFSLNYMKSSIRGIVSDTKGNGVNNASVIIDGVASTTTLPDGSYTLANVLPGKYTITISHPDFISTTINDVTLTADQQLSGINGVLTSKYGTVSGTVTDNESSKAISGVAVTISGSGISTTTNANGEYVLSNITAGTYSFTFTHSDYVDTIIRNITIKPGESLSAINISVIKKKGTLTGTVYNLQKRVTLSGVTVTLTPGGKTTTTSLSGKFSLTDLTAQTYTMQLLAGSGFFDTTYTNIIINPGKLTNFDTMYIKEKNHTKTIGGTLNGEISIVNIITATITGDSIVKDAPLVTTLSWFPASMQYSGTIEIPSVGTQWSVEIRVYDKAGNITGYKKESFSRATGTVAMPSFNCENARPKALAGNDTTVSINDKINLRGNAIDSFNISGTITNPTSRSNIKSWEWSIDGGVFEKQSADSTITAPSSAKSNLLCILRVTDIDNNLSYSDTLNLTVVKDIPVANAGSDTTLPMNDTYTLKGSASQQFGFITKWEWSINGNTFRQTSKDTTIKAPSVDTDWVCILKVTDDDMNVDSDTVVLSFGKWEVVGGGVISDGSVGYFEIKTGNNNAYIAFMDYFSDTGLSVIRFDGNNIQSIGNRLYNGDVVSNNGARSPLSMAIDGNTIGILLRKKFSKTNDSSYYQVIKHTNSNWYAWGTPFDTMSSSLSYTRDCGTIIYSHDFYYASGSHIIKITEHSRELFKSANSTMFGSIFDDLFTLNGDLFVYCNEFIGYNYKHISFYKLIQDSTHNITSINGNYPVINTDNNQAYLLYSDAGQLKVSIFDGATLTPVALNSVPNDSLVDLTSCYTNSSNYVVYPYRQVTNTKFRFGKITNGTWKELNPIDGFSISEPILFSVKNKIYLAYKDTSNGDRLSLLKLD